jgi:hypothetical protein
VASSAEARRFVAGQKRYNEALRGALDAGTADTGLRDRLRMTLAAEAGVMQSNQLRRIAGEKQRAGWRSIAWPIGVAAALVIGLFVGSMFNRGGSGEPEPVTPTAAIALASGHVSLDDLSQVSSSLMLVLGTRENDKLSEYAKSIGLKHAIPAYAPKQSCKMMAPVSVQAGEVGGVRYEAVCFCAGVLDEECAVKRPGTGRLDRLVLFFFEGDAVPPGAACDKTGVWCQRGSGHIVFARYCKESNTTCVVSLPGDRPEERAREMASPLLSVEAAGVSANEPGKS